MADRIFETENTDVQFNVLISTGVETSPIFQPKKLGCICKYYLIYKKMWVTRCNQVGSPSSLHAEIVLKGLDMGIKRQLPGRVLITHTDRGSQYASEKYRNLLEENRIKASMSRKGNCYDNAFVEIFSTH